MAGKAALYTRAEPGRISEHVVLSGDPWRVEVLKDLLERPEHVAFAREFNTYTGTYKGMRVTVSSTGIGAPSAAIALEELHEAGMRVAVRMGTVMGLEEDLLGAFIIPVGAMREESTSAAYVPPSYPAVADMRLVASMNAAVKVNGGRAVNGITCSMDRFYGRMKESEFSRAMGDDVQERFAGLRRYGVCGIDMESSLVLTLGRLMGVRVCVVTLTTVLANLASSMVGEERTKAEALLCRVVLDGLVVDQKEH
jgi:uridine phosphorylase